MRLVPALAMLLAGCAAPTAADYGIIGGELDPGDPAVVLLFGRQAELQVGWLCTATVIAPTLLLTAAHCVLPPEEGPPPTFEAVLAADWARATPEEWLDVAEVHADPAFRLDDLGAGHDIAVARLAHPVAIPPLPWNRAPLDPGLVGAPLRIVGYGNDNGAAATGAGLRRQTSAPLRAFNDRLLHVGDSSRQTCNGDSGGPALATLGGRETIVGVTSFGQIGCVGGGFHTRVDAYAAFLDAFLEPPAAPAPCGGATPVRGPNGACVECAADADCGAPLRLRCEPGAHRCVACADDPSHTCR